MINWNRSIRPAVVLASLLALALSACGGDDGDDGGAGASAGSGTSGSGGSASTGGTVTGTVSYAGSKQGDLILAVFTEWPTAGAPEMFVKIPSPSFPQAYELEGMTPGDYYIFAFLDVPPASPTLPGSEDVQSTPTATVSVSDTEPAKMDVTLPSD